MELAEDAPQPRLCHLIKWPNFDGYGFNLHAEKAKAGQYIGKVDDDSPAQAAGLKEGDRIIEVNLVNISNENHRQVVERIKSNPNETKLLVLDEAADRWYKERKIVVKSSQPNVIYRKTPESPMKQNGSVDEESSPPPTPPIKVNGNSAQVTVDKAEEHNGVAVVVEVPDVHVNNSSQNGAAQRDSPVLENGANSNSSRSSTPQSSNHVELQNINRPSSSGSNANNSCSIPGSPTSSKSGSSTGQMRSLSDNGEGLNLNMTASEMRQMLAQKKKMDVKKAQIDLRQKYEIIQQM